MKRTLIAAALVVGAAACASADPIVTPTGYRGVRSWTTLGPPYSSTDLREVTKEDRGAGANSGSGSGDILSHYNRFEFDYFYSHSDPGPIDDIRLLGRSRSEIDVSSSLVSEIMVHSMTRSSAKFEVVDPVRFRLYGTLEIPRAEVTGSGLGNSSALVQLLLSGNPTAIEEYSLADFKTDTLTFDISGELLYPDEYELLLGTSATVWSQEEGTTMLSESFAEATLELRAIPAPAGTLPLIAGLGFASIRRRRG